MNFKKSKRIITKQSLLFLTKAFFWLISSLGFLFVKFNLMFILTLGLSCYYIFKFFRNNLLLTSDIDTIPLTNEEIEIKNSEMKKLQDIESLKFFYKEK